MTLQLTFDDGPSEWTPAILDLLAEHNQKATFFVIGQHVVANEGILLRMDYEGHAIGNHTWSHPRLTDAETSTKIWREFRETSAAIAKVTGTWPAAWRAPYFAHDDRVDLIAREFGLTRHIGADIVPEDCFTEDAVLIAERVLHRHAAGDDQHSAIVSLHDGIPPDGGSEHCTQSRQPTVDAVRMILEALA